MEPVKWTDLSLSKFMMATSLLALVDNTIFYPFDLLKTREHVEKMDLRGKNPISITVQQIKQAVLVPHPTDPSKPPRFNPRGIYKGYWTSTVANIPCYIVYLCAYSYAKHLLGWDPNAPDQPMRNLLAPMVAGAAADFVSLGLYVPTEVVTKRIQLKDSPFTNGFSAARHIWQSEGLRGFYVGTGVTLLQSGLGSGTWWLVYEAAKDYLTNKKVEKRGRHAERREDMPTSLNDQRIVSQTVENSGFRWKSEWNPEWQQYVSGGVASAVACTVVNPFDVVRSRLQTQDGPHKEYRTTLQGLRMIVAQEGWLSLSLIHI